MTMRHVRGRNAAACDEKVAGQQTRWTGLDVRNPPAERPGALFFPAEAAAHQPRLT
jgi:hypothetical protein